MDNTSFIKLPLRTLYNQMLFQLIISWPIIQESSALNQHYHSPLTSPPTGVFEPPNGDWHARQEAPQRTLGRHHETVGSWRSTTRKTRHHLCYWLLTAAGILAGMLLRCFWNVAGKSSEVLGRFCGVLLLKKRMDDWGSVLERGRWVKGRWARGYFGERLINGCALEERIIGVASVHIILKMVIWCEWGWLINEVYCEYKKAIVFKIRRSLWLMTTQEWFMKLKIKMKK